MRHQVIAAALLLLGAVPAAAQLTPEQARAVKEQPSVFVVAADRTWTGRLLGMDATSVTIQPQEGAPRTFALSDVLRVETTRWDSPFDGALAGGLVMMAWSLFAGATFGAEMTRKGQAVLQLTAYGMLVGGAIDAAHRSKVTLILYERPSSLTTSRPRGVFFTVRF